MIEPYINLRGRADEAMRFYESVFGGTDKKVMKYADMPDPHPEGTKDYVAHAQIKLRGTLVHFSDLQEDAEPGNMISLAVHLNTPEEAAEIYHKLTEGGEALMALEAQHFARAYAWVKDRFGVGWQLICE